MQHRPVWLYCVLATGQHGGFCGKLSLATACALDGVGQLFATSLAKQSSTCDLPAWLRSLLQSLSKVPAGPQAAAVGWGTSEKVGVQPHSSHRRPAQDSMPPSV